MLAKPRPLDRIVDVDQSTTELYLRSPTHSLYDDLAESTRLALANTCAIAAPQDGMEILGQQNEALNKLKSFELSWEKTVKLFASSAGIYSIDDFFEKLYRKALVFKHFDEEGIFKFVIWNKLRRRNMDRRYVDTKFHIVRQCKHFVVGRE